MNLSISSSSNIRIICGSLLIALIMLLSFHILISAGIVPEGIGETQQKRNIIKVENYLLPMKPLPENVALGSSFLENVLRVDVDNQLLNLSFGGLSGLEGCELLQRSNSVPKKVVIELSSALIRKPSDIVRDAMPEYKQFLLSTSPIFRMAYQPSSILLRLIRAAKESRSPNQTAIAIGRKSRELPITEEQRQRLNNNLEHLKQFVDQLQKRGTSIYFVEVPVDRQVWESQYETEIRQILHGRFPETNCRWIIPDRSRDWKTSDGIHLTVDEARTIKRQILRCLNLS
jgi:hypothetical protein